MSKDSLISSFHLFIFFFSIHWFSSSSTDMFGTFSAAHSNPHIFLLRVLTFLQVLSNLIITFLHLSSSHFTFSNALTSNFHWQCCQQQPKCSVVLFSFPDTITTLQSFTHLFDHRTANWNVNNKVLHRKKFRH